MRPYRYLVGVYSELDIKYMVSDQNCWIHTPTTDSNINSYHARTGMIWVTRNEPSATNRPGTVREFNIVWRVITLINYWATLIGWGNCLKWQVYIASSWINVYEG